MHDLRRLTALLAVAEHASFSEAALELGYAQSVVSHHVATLEQELGVVLVDRGSRPVGLTEAGERMCVHARDILGRVGDAEADLRALAGLRAGSLRMSAFLAASISFIPEVVRAFRAARPDVSLHLAQLSSDAALDALRAGGIDLAVIWTPGQAPPQFPGVAAETLAMEPYRIALPAGHPLARRRGRVGLEDLASEAFTVPRSGGRDGDRYLAWLRARCASAGFEPDARYPVDDVTVGRAFVASGLCVGVLPHLTLSGAGPDIAIRELPGDDAFRTLTAVWREGRGVPAVPPMLELLRQLVPAHVARAA